MLDSSGLRCCAVQQLSGLCSYAATPVGTKRAMLDACEVIFRRNGPVKFSKPYSFYIFNGVVAIRKGSRDFPLYPATSFGYVEAFRDFILEHNLGEVTSSTPEWNRVGAPTHKVMMCVWRPDPKRLKAWYLENKA